MSKTWIWSDPKHVYYRPQRSCGQGNVFTGVCLSTGGGCLPQCMLGCQTHPRDQADPPGSGRSPGTRQTPPDQADPPRPGRPPWDQTDPPWDQADAPRNQAHPPGSGRPPRDQADPPGSRLQHTVYERPVRILLERILVWWISISRFGGGGVVVTLLNFSLYSCFLSTDSDRSMWTIRNSIRIGVGILIWTRLRWIAP